jgi:hypothetical protein
MSNPVPNLFASSGLVLTTVLLALPDGWPPRRSTSFDAFVAPMHEMARLRYIAVDDPAIRCVGINQFQHGRRLLDHRLESSPRRTTTIYSSARLDLHNGPVKSRYAHSKRYYRCSS